MEETSGAEVVPHTKLEAPLPGERSCVGALSRRQIRLRGHENRNWGHADCEWDNPLDNVVVEHGRSMWAGGAERRSGEQVEWGTG